MGGSKWLAPPSSTATATIEGAHLTNTQNVHALTHARTQMTTYTTSRTVLNCQPSADIIIEL